MYFLALFMCLYFHDKLPIFFKNYFKTNDKVHTYTTRSASIIHITYIKDYKYGKFSLSYRGATVWNSLTTKSYSKFKTSLKVYIQNDLHLVG